MPTKTHAITVMDITTATTAPGEAWPDGMVGKFCVAGSWDIVGNQSNIAPSLATSKVIRGASRKARAKGSVERQDDGRKTELDRDYIQTTQNPSIHPGGLVQCCKHKA